MTPKETVALVKADYMQTLAAVLNQYIILLELDDPDNPRAVRFAHCVADSLREWQKTLEWAAEEVKKR